MDALDEEEKRGKEVQIEEDSDVDWYVQHLDQEVVEGVHA